MTTSGPPHGGRSHTSGEGGYCPAGVRDAPLELRVVEYDDRPDRGTVYPPDSTGFERMETWISVDTSALVALSAWR